MFIEKGKRSSCFHKKLFRLKMNKEGGRLIQYCEHRDTAAVGPQLTCGDWPESFCRKDFHQFSSGSRMEDTWAGNISSVMGKTKAKIR